MKRSVLGLILILLFASFCLPQSEAQAAPVAPGISITVTPLELIPGQSGMVFVAGGYPLDISVYLDSEPIGVFWTGRGYISTFAFGPDAEDGEHRLLVVVENPQTGQRIAQTKTITVGHHHYPLEKISLGSGLNNLLTDEINAREERNLQTVYRGYSQPGLVSWPFSLPPEEDSPITSHYGALREYNGGSLRSRHTGTDFRHYRGQPVAAIAEGRVAAAEAFDIRGNVVIINHGFGLYTQYAHLDVVNVRAGQIVEKGQILGTAGSSGRSMGPHLHLEFVVLGQPVDAIQWLALNPAFEMPRVVLPTPTPAPDETENMVGGN